MEITLEKLLRWFYFGSVAVMLVGAGVLIMENDYDVYTIWATLAYIVGAYLLLKNDIKK